VAGSQRSGTGGDPIVIDVLTAELRAPITEDTAELYVGGTVFKTGPPARRGRHREAA
jgi:hypothetical protein